MSKPEVHLCHALGCSERVMPSRLMCPRHWYMVPAPLRREVWRTYRPGQEVDKSPSRSYVDAADAAIAAVANAEGLAPSLEEKTLARLELLLGS